ncbi:myb-related transcription factor, partner of profilin-like [Mytilus edulis]|uniref:myb-related transcription factor, partner of profilin-like n=1 Tax=Mytilus edulis TaxID=6550 RepID=UPI0039EED7DE
MADLPSASACNQSNVKKTRERKPNFSETEINLLQDEVEKNYAVINDKFGSSLTNKRKTAVWGRISMMVSSLGVAHRSAKECKDKWGNTKKEAKKIFSVNKRDQGKTGGGPQAKPVSVAVNRTIDLCKDSASFKGIGGVESCIIAGATEARLSEDDSEMACTGSQDLFQSAMECQSESSLQPPTPPSPQSPSVLSGFIGNRAVPIVVNLPVNNESRAVPTAATVTKKRKATAGDVHELQVVYFRGEIEKQKKEMKKLDLQIELLERIKAKEYQPMSLSQCLEALGTTN